MGFCVWDDKLYIFSNKRPLNAEKTAKNIWEY